MKKEDFFNGCDPEWLDLLSHALDAMDQDYLKALTTDTSWLPGLNRICAAFSLPLSKLNYVLLGESPYPRAASANGYAFWDNAVDSLWGEHGLSKAVNRATSLRNWIKLLLLARGSLSGDTSQEAIKHVDKKALVHTAEAFFLRMMDKGILLLNACLVYKEGEVPYHARQWKPFMQSILAQLALKKPDTELILLGAIAKAVPHSLAIGLMAEHPYNISFITNPKVIEFFKPLDLLSND